MKKKLALSLLLLSSCSHFDPDLPKTDTAVVWKEKLEGTETFTACFWEKFNDPILNRYIEEAIAGNFDLEAAAQRIEQARAYTKKEHAKRLPSVDVTASVTEDETLLNPSFYGLGSSKEKRVGQRLYNLLADFSYEIDLWGKLKDQEKSARQKTAATVWQHSFVYQTVVADVAATYFTLRTLEAEIRFLSEATKLRHDRIHLHDERVKAGLDSEMNLSRAKLELTLAESELEEARRDYAIQQNAFAMLLGKCPSSFTWTEGTLPDEVPALAQVLPSEMLMRRADVQEAWMTLASSQTDVNVAMKAYFPSFALTTQVGLTSPALSTLFNWQARYWQYVLSAFQPLFDGGRRKAEVRLKKAQFYENFALYQKTVNRAFQDVEDALSTYHSLKAQSHIKARALEAAKETASLAGHQSKAGLISYLLTADEEDRLLKAERQVIALKGEQLIAWIRLNKALGIDIP